MYAYPTLAAAEKRGLSEGWIGFVEFRPGEYRTIRIQPKLSPATWEEHLFFVTNPRFIRRVQWKQFVGLEKHAADRAAAKFPKMSDSLERLRFQAAYHGDLVEGFKKQYELLDWQLEFILFEAISEKWKLHEIYDPAER